MTNQAANDICDLHIHSIYSDSDATVTEIFDRAKEKNVRCISITDHDCVEAAAQAHTYARQYNIEYIDGVELSCCMDNTEVHLLGYGIDSTCVWLRDALEQVKQSRKDRFGLMIDKLHTLGVKVDKDDVIKKNGNSVLTRLHLGLYLAEKKIVSSVVEAFKKYLGAGRPAYIARFKFTVQEAIEVIHQSGGLAFLAHPHLLAQQSWVERICGLGIDGLEYYYPFMHQNKRVVYDELIQRFNILRSGGSDAHGSYKTYTNIGETAVPYSVIEAIRQRLAKNNPAHHASK